MLLVALWAIVSGVAAVDQNDTTLPTKSGIGIYVDPMTPADAHTKVSSRGGTWTLVMSDEFEVEGRNFTAGEDPVWTALDIPDGVNRAWEIYTPENVYTKDGNLVIRVDEGPQEVSYWNNWAAKPAYETKTMWYKAAMVQSWNKFCIQGGLIEIAAKLPGAVDPKSRNPHITGTWVDPVTKKKVKLAANDRIPDVQFYPTWPGLWLMGNLGRALFGASTTRMWPWTYNECDERYSAHQRISACDGNPGFGLNPYQGRGAPEIDILEGGGTEISTSIQIAPGMPDEYRRIEPNKSYDGDNTVCYYAMACKTPGANMPDAPTAVYAKRKHKSWYQGLRYAANDKCAPIANETQSYASVAAAQGNIVSNTYDIKTMSAARDVNSDLGLIDGVGPRHWGINYAGTCFPVANGYIGGFLCDPDAENIKCANPRLSGTKTKQMDSFEYQMD
ncbi:beta-glucan synthesis-associated protein, partial [Achlya hypogyna]